MTDWFSMDVPLPTDTMQLYADLGQRMPALVQTNLRRYGVRIVKPRLLGRVRFIPDPVVYGDNGKLRWKSPKQRRAFFASNGFGGGIPTTRTGDYQDGFDVEYEGQDYDGFIRLTNSEDYSIYVGGDENGDQQQPFHADTGYPLIANIIAEESPIINEGADILVQTLADPEAAFASV